MNYKNIKFSFNEKGIVLFQVYHSDKNSKLD